MATKRLIISSTGYPGTNDTWRAVNNAILENAEALAKLCGDKTILVGVELEGGNYTDGWVAFNGEILPFVGGAPQENVTVIVTEQTAEYDADNNADTVNDILPISQTRHIQFGTGGVATFPFSDLKRLKSILQLSEFELPDNLVIDAAYVHTDNNFTTELLNKLLGIAAGAEVNVQADWNVVNTESDAFIKNKPTDLQRVLKKGTLTVGDVSNSPEFTVSFASIGTSLYNVNIGFESITAASAQATASVFYSVHTKTATSFKIQLKESGNITQNLRITYEITPQ